MSVFNINTLQKLAYTGTPRDLQTYSDMYLKQSLANLGQRFSIKGDGVALGKFAIYELNNSWPVPNEEDYEEYGKLHYAYMLAEVQPKVDDDGDLDITLTACRLKDEGGIEYDSTIVLNEEDYYEFASDVYVSGDKVTSLTSAPIAYYGLGTFITDAGEGIWKQASRDISIKHELQNLTFDNYDTHNERIVEGLHMYEVEENFYVTCLSYVSHDFATGIDNYKVTQYVAKSDSQVLRDMEEAWSYIMDPDNGPVKSGKAKMTWTANDVLYSIIDDLDFIGECDATMNDGTYEISCDSDTFEEAFHSNTLIGDIVEDNVLQWNQSLTIGLPFIRRYYNNVNYLGTDNNLRFKRRLFAEILVELYNNYIDESQGSVSVDNVFQVYLPYEYVFVYTCNSQNTAQVYSSAKDIMVESTVDPTKDLWKITETGNNGVREQLMICTACDITDDQEDVYSIWKYFVTYDNDGLVNDIIAMRAYVLPYVNSDGYWNINNVDTSIYARGKDGGNPSMIIKYANTYTGEREILSTMFRDELEEALDWDITYFKVKPLDTSSAIGSNAFHMMTTYMPQNISTAYLHENLVTFLENAIIMDISSVMNEDTSQSTTSQPLADPSQLGEYATVTTFWALSKEPETNKYYFTYVKQPGQDWAIDFNYLTDAEAIVQYYMQLGMQPDVYRHRWLVFNNVSHDFKNQERASGASVVNPVVMNKLFTSFSDMFNIETTTGNQYQNNLNFILGFYNQVEYKGSYISGVKDDNIGRFFKFDYNTEASSYTVPVVAQKKSSTDTELTYDYYPNVRPTSSQGAWNDTLLPVLDLKEIFVRNINTFNRYNVLTPSNDENDEGAIYYSYIGSTFEDPNKSILHIGTALKNINLGTQTLTTDEERGHFAPQHEIDIDFNTIVLNGDVIMPKASWAMYAREDDPSDKMFSTIYDMAWIWLVPAGSGETVPTYNSFDTAGDVEKLRYFRMPKKVSDDIANIGNGVSVEGKNTYMSYVNINWLMQDIWKVIGTTNAALQAGRCAVYGEAGKLFTYDNDGTPTYFLQLSTDIADLAERLYNYTSGQDGEVYFIKPGALDVSYAPRYGRGLITNVRLNVKELTSTHSTTCSIYDGGEL